MSNVIDLPARHIDPPDVDGVPCDNGCMSRKETWLYAGRVLCCGCALPIVMDLDLDGLKALTLCDLIAARDVLDASLEEGEPVEPAFRIVESEVRRRTGAYQGTR